ASASRALKAAGLRDRPTPRSPSQGKGFVPPLGPPEHGPVAVWSSNVAGTSSSRCRRRDGGGRLLVPGELREAMAEADGEQVRQRAREKSPGVPPRLIAANGPPLLARDFH